MPNPRGQIVSSETSMGKTIDEYLFMLFVWNEHQWAHDPDLVLDDDELATLMLKAYPGRSWSRNLVAISRHRARFNRGRLRPQKAGHSPKAKSYCYERFPGGVRRWTEKTARGKWPTKKVKKQRTSIDKVVVTDLPARKETHGKEEGGGAHKEEQGSHAGTQRS